MRVAVIGTGHVGLATCVSLASMGHDVAGIDADREKIVSLQRGVAPVFEPGLQELLSEATRQGHLRFALTASDVVPGADVVLICVGTPPNADGDADLVAVERSAIEVARHATADVVVVEKSTVPVGTADRLGLLLRRHRPDVQIHVVSNPEFLREGSALKDALDPERILVGADSDIGFSIMRRLYSPLTGRGIRLIETDLRTAEIAKHASNAFLALKISYANALARVCERSGADVTAVTDVMGADPRIGPAFLEAGLGYGGYCLTKDLVAFGRLAARLGYEFPLLYEVQRINEEAIDATAEKVRDAVRNIGGKRIAFLGLSFKPNTDDVRFSPALALARRLLNEGADIVGYDPQAGAEASLALNDLKIAGDAYSAAEGADALVVATAWDEFLELDLERIRAGMEHPVVVDGRNLFDATTMVAAGFEYYATGRPMGLPTSGGSG